MSARFLSGVKADASEVVLLRPGGVVLASVFGMLALNGLPMPYHPVFNVARFSRATEDKFFLVIFSTDAKYNAQDTRTFLQGLGAKAIEEVPA